MKTEEKAIYKIISQMYPFITGVSFVDFGRDMTIFDMVMDVSLPKFKEFYNIKEMKAFENAMNMMGGELLIPSDNMINYNGDLEWISDMLELTSNVTKVGYRILRMMNPNKFRQIKFYYFKFKMI
jgi:hypothetical protein